MKTSMGVFLLLALMVPAIAQNNFRAATKKRVGSQPSNNCSGATTHAHQYSDIRVALVEVSEIDDCGFNYIDVEHNSVGMDQRFEFKDDFLATRQNDESDGKAVRFTKLSKHDVKRGERGVAFYCSYCKTVFSLKF